MDVWSDLESTASTYRVDTRPTSFYPASGRRRFGGGAAPPMPPMLTGALGGFDELAIPSVQSTSMLTCNKEFHERYPYVFQGLCKGLIDVRMLMAYEMVVPLKESIQLKRSVIRGRKAVVNAIASRLRKSLKGKFPDPKMSTKLTFKISDYIWEQLQKSIRDAEDERTFVQWLLRLEVDADCDIRLSVSHCESTKDSILTHVEGSIHVVRRKGDLFSLINSDTLSLNLDCVVKALFINDGQLGSMNRDPQFIDFVRTGDNRFAKRLMY